MLYNYFDDGGYIGIIGFLFVLCLMIGLILGIIVSPLKMVFSNGAQNVRTELAIRGVVLLVFAVLTFFIGRQSVRAISYSYDYARETYRVISGKLEDVRVAPSGGRGEFYVVSFKVSDLDFNNTNISTRIENAESIKDSENQEVTVSYKMEKEQQFVYKIEVLNH